MKECKIIIDGSNVAFFQRNENKEARIQNLEILLNFLETLKDDFGIKYQIITDASLQHRIDDDVKLETLYNTGKIIQCARGIKADDIIIEYTKRHPEETIIISNDCFKEYDLSNIKLLKFAIIFGEFITKPDIKEFLELVYSNVKEDNRIVESI